MKKVFEAHSNQKIDEAIKYYKKFIELNFSDPFVFLNYGCILRDLGDLEEAEKITRKAIEIKEEYAKAYTNLGIILNDLGRKKKKPNSLK